MTAQRRAYVGFWSCPGLYSNLFGNLNAETLPFRFWRVIVLDGDGIFPASFIIPMRNANLFWAGRLRRCRAPVSRLGIDSLFSLEMFFWHFGRWSGRIPRSIPQAIAWRVKCTCQMRSWLAHSGNFVGIACDMCLLKSRLFCALCSIFAVRMGKSVRRQRKTSALSGWKRQTIREHCLPKQKQHQNGE